MKYKLKIIDKALSWGAKDPRNPGKIMPKFQQCSDTYTVGLDKNTGAVRTGFSDNDEDKSDKLAAKRRTLEKKLSLKDGDLYASSSYWTNFSIKIPARGIEIDTSNALGQLYEHLLTTDPQVITDVDELKTNGLAVYSLLSDASISKKKNSNRKIKTEAFSKFGKLTNTQVADVLYMYGQSGCEDRDPEVNREELGELMETNPQRFLDKSNDVDLTLKVELLKAIRKGVVTKSGLNAEDSYLKYGTTELGMGLDVACSFLKDKENQTIYRNIVKDLKA